ncbi:hypothetical protein M405DRAFT_737007 [Rhizopogon salebrosus TDB-379]|nr:hypothetical protein M405DRAFT_737007 [Rhizopogon salebrosus TDB-379]
MDSTFSPLPRAFPDVSPNTGPAIDLGLSYEEGYDDPVYQAKARILNHAIQDIGMGRYQWYLFVVAGFGWFADLVWPLLSGLIPAPVVNEFHFNGPFLSLASNVGLLVGAVFWGLGCDIWGWRYVCTMHISESGICSHYMRYPGDLLISPCLLLACSD